MENVNISNWIYLAYGKAREQIMTSQIVFNALDFAAILSDC